MHLGFNKQNEAIHYFQWMLKMTNVTGYQSLQCKQRKKFELLTFFMTVLENDTPLISAY